MNLNNQQQRAEFEGRYSRCRSSLYFLAWGALGNVAEAEQAMESCYRKASREPRRFSSDGEFGSWMIRMLIDEIVEVANERKDEFRNEQRGVRGNAIDRSMGGSETGSGLKKICTVLHKYPQGFEENPLAKCSECF